MSENPGKPSQERIVRPVMLGLMAGSAVFLVERWLLTIAVETALIVAAGVAVAVAMFLIQRPDRS